MANRWGYKGTETALNGLVQWLSSMMIKQINWKDGEHICLHIIIHYAKKHIPGFKKRGHAINCADKIAKKIDRAGTFQHFCTFAKETYFDILN